MSLLRLLVQFSLPSLVSQICDTMDEWEAEIVKKDHPIWRILLVLVLGLLGLGGLSTTDLLAGVL